jgi:phosphoesterase RecJ-like protein
MILAEDFLKLKDKIKQSQTLLIIHPRPDGDALGSGLALLNWGLKEKLPIRLFCQDPVPINYRYLNNWFLITQDKNIFNQDFNLIIVLDSSDLEYAGLRRIFPFLKKKAFIAKIDHHVAGENYGDFELVDEKASATCEILYRFFKVNDISLDKDIATALLTGLITDTGNFTNQATTPASLAIAGKLMLLGAEIKKINHQVNKNKTVNMLKLWGRALARLQRNEKTGFVSTVILQKDLKECGVEEEAAEGVANFLNSLKDARAVLVLKEQEDGFIKGSLRTNQPDIDVSKIARLLGGGGHKKAAGFTIPGRIIATQKGWQIV